MFTNPSRIYLLDHFLLVYESGWKFKSVKTNKKYSWSDFTDLKSSRYDFYMREYENKLIETETYEMSPVFHLYWLETIMMYQAMDYSEDIRENYIKNIDPMIKNPGKEHQRSEKLAEQAYDNFYEKYRSM